MTHWSKAWKTLVHNGVRDTIYRLYRSSILNLVATKEAKNLYPAPSEMRPADVLVQLPEGPVAYDVTICDHLRSHSRHISAARQQQAAIESSCRGYQEKE